MEALLKRYETLHQNPEVSGHEKQTAVYLMEQLKAMGYQPVRIGRYGVYADLCVDPTLPWVVLRADMDALPVTENSGAAYASRNPGVMHACGHDAHMAMLLTAAEALKERTLPQNIRFFFQPAEEIIIGAEEMIDAGALPERIAAMFGVHVWPQIPKGKVVAKAGPLMASSTTIQIRCSGKAAHCGTRDKGADALMTAVQIAAGFREAEALAEGDGSVLFCGKLQAGTVHNVVAAEAVLDGTLRTFYSDTREKILRKLEQLAADAAKTYGTTVEVIYKAYSPEVHNPENLALQVQKLLPDAITELPPTLIAEDFSYYQKLCPGMLLWLGVGDAPALHNDKFLVPQDVLPVGVETWIRLAQHKW